MGRKKNLDHIYKPIKIRLGMHIHYHFKLGLWQRLAILIVILSGTATITWSLANFPNQQEIISCTLGKAESAPRAQRADIYSKSCQNKILEASIKINNFMFISKNMAIWITSATGIYFLFFLFSWVSAGNDKRK
ncbi:hypothetical protein D3C84_880500 [compost metagenome]